jgi:predicted dithiol-disulfide oxidoreductase (DUF899 family)
VERKLLLTNEKQLTRLRDRVNADRRRLPMVRIDKEYVFEGENGKARLADLFDGRRQLIVYHFVQAAHGLDRALVLVVRQRLQL